MNSDLEMTVENSINATDSQPEVVTVELSENLASVVKASFGDANNLHPTTFKEFIPTPTVSSTSSETPKRKLKVGHACVLTESPYKRMLSESKHQKLETERRKEERKAKAVVNKFEKELSNRMKVLSNVTENKSHKISKKKESLKTKTYRNVDKKLTATNLEGVAKPRLLIALHLLGMVLLHAMNVALLKPALLTLILARIGSSVVKLVVVPGATSPVARKVAFSMTWSFFVPNVCLLFDSSHRAFIMFLLCCFL